MTQSFVLDITINRRPIYFLKAVLKFIYIQSHSQSQILNGSERTKFFLDDLSGLTNIFDFSLKKHRRFIFGNHILIFHDLNGQKSVCLAVEENIMRKRSAFKCFYFRKSISHLQTIIPCIIKSFFSLHIQEKLL